jgi:hypothetical protein
MDRSNDKVFILTTPSLTCQKLWQGASASLPNSLSILITKQAGRRLA